MGAGRTYQTQALKAFRATGSIPASGGAAVTAASICTLTDAQIQRVMGYKVCAQLVADGSDRPAFIVDDVEYVAAGVEYKPPLTNAAMVETLKSAGSAITASFVFFLAPGD